MRTLVATGPVGDIQPDQPHQMVLRHGCETIPILFDKASVDSPNPGAHLSRGSERSVTPFITVVLLTATCLTAICSCGRSTPRVWVVSPWHAFDTPVHDLGIGLVGLRESTGLVPRSDTLVFRSAPSRSAPVSTLLIMRTDTSATPIPSWHYAVAADETLSVNMVEHDYEIAGVPIDSIVDGGRWAHGLLGRALGGRWVTGFVEIDTTRMIFLKWSDRLRELDLPIYARDSSGLSFSATVDGTPVRAVPRRNLAIYAADTVVGSWLRVRVVWPSDECIPPDSIRRTERRLWVRYLDARGRPTVWYHSRGC